MAKKKQEEAAKGSPAWMATFSDLMNLLLCFFVLLFSMSTVDAEKFEMVVASLQSSFSVLPSGGSSVGEGELISSGVSQLKEFSMFFEQFSSEGESEEQEEKEKDLREAYEEEALKESEEMAEEINSETERYGIQNQVEVDFNAQYVLLTLNGALLFDSGKSEIREDAYPLIDKIGAILTNYNSNIIEIEGHTDNVPISSSQYPSNEELSSARALSVFYFLVDNTLLDPTNLRHAGMGERVPIADNSTAEGRSRNRRVEIRIYNSAR